jgi:hypothetical protein
LASPDFPSEMTSRTTEANPPRIDIKNGCLAWRAGRLRCELHAGPDTWRIEKQEGKKTFFRAGHGDITVDYRDDAFDVSIYLNKEAQGCTPELVIFNTHEWRIVGKTACVEGWALRRHFPFPPEAHYVWQRTMPWVGPPLYNGVAPTGRLWQSILEPLDPACAEILFDGRRGAGLVFSSINTNARNIVLTDRADEASDVPYALALRFYRVDPDLNPRTTTFGLGQPWSLESYPAVEADEQSVQFTLTLNDIGRWCEKPRKPLSRAEAEVTCEGEQIRRGADAIWFVKPGTVTWSDLVPVKGRYRIRFELRHSEASATGTDLDNAYEIRIDNDLVPLEWIKRNTYQTGNAYFGYAMTPAFDLAERGRSISITATKPWCAQRGDFHLVPADAP